MRPKLVFYAWGIIALGFVTSCATMPRAADDPFADLRATIVRETAQRQDLQSILVNALDGANEALRRGDADEGNRLLDDLGDRVWQARGEALSDDSVIRIFESGTISAERVVARRWLDHYWTRIEPFPNRRCMQGSCRTPDRNWDCYMVSVCGEHKGCIARRK